MSASATATCSEDDVVEIPSAPGAYGLILTLVKPLRFKGHLLAAATYLYAGSARGPGGLRARIGRHLKEDKKIHWHVDRLTDVARVGAVYALVGGDECEIVETALKIKGVSAPVPGFGSSDCRICPAHLLRLPDGFEAGSFFAKIRSAKSG
ncbi:MAG: GIY-YIG nuclease family protein [Rhodospirillales bacterium]|nr:GIY-YIG nuclease family protein [Rhodospirillales bacterium]